MDLLTALSGRRSVRAFLPEPVPPGVLRAIFDEAQKAPSWCNIQPWKVTVASGERRAKFVAAMVEAATTEVPRPDIPFPEVYPEPYAERRKACGKVLYEAMEVARADHAGKQAAWIRNFEAFGAPHVAICGIDRRFGEYATLDLGCWLQSLLLAAHAAGVATCAQASLALFPDIARASLGISDDVRIIFGVALGFEAPEAKVNRARTDRAPLDMSVAWVE